MSEPWMEEAGNEIWQHRDEPEMFAGIIAKHHAACALSAKCAAERVVKLTAAARYLMVAMHSCAASESRADVLAIARDAAMKWPELAPGSEQPTTPPLDSSSAAR